MALENTNYYRKIAASAARTASTNFPDQANQHHRGVAVTIDATGKSATPSVTFSIQGKDPLSGKYYTLLTSAAITDTGTTTLTVYPGIAATSNVSASAVLPAEWRVISTASDGDALTYSIGANMLL